MWMIIPAIIGTIALALWLAFTNNAMFALPLVIVVAGLVRTLVRRIVGKRFTPADVEIEVPPREP